MPQFLGQLHKWLEGHSKDPGEWTFANLKRNDDGSFEDEPLVRLLQVGAANVAGMFRFHPWRRIVPQQEV